MKRTLAVSLGRREKTPEAKIRLRWPKHIAVLLVSLVCHSCCTIALWKSSNLADDSIWIEDGSVTEQQLVVQGVEYRKCEDPILGAGYLIKKSDLRKFRDYTLVVFLTPMTVGVDIVVGVLKDPGPLVTGLLK